MKQLLAVAVLLCAVTARAEGDGKSNAGWAACKGDAERLCAGAEKPGMCLHEHWNELSAECRSYKEGMKKKWEAEHGGKGEKGDGKKWHEKAMAVCGDDLKRLCPDAPNPGMCLHEKLEQLSPACREFKTGKHEGKGDKGAPEKKGKMKFEWSGKKGA